jgi:hypothetical protein
MARGYPDYRYFSFPVSVNEGGTGATSFTFNGVLLGNATSAFLVTAAGAADEVLRVPAAGGAPAFGPLDLSKAAAVTGLLPVAKGGTGTATPSLVAGTGIQITGSWPNQTVTNTSPASALGDPVTIAHGGTGTATPALVAGANITITGSWPNNTVALKSPLDGVLWLGDGTGAQYFVINGGASQLREVQFRTNSSDRWHLRTDSSAESGANAGSNFGLDRFSDAGVNLGTAFYIRRSDSQVGIGNVAPGKALDVTGDVRASLQLISSVATGTAPLAVTSTTKVANLNAERISDTWITNSAFEGALLLGTAAPGAAWGYPDGARVYNSAVESIPTAAETALTFDSERYDNGGLHDNVTNNSRLTAQKAGVYLITGHVAFAANATGKRRVNIITGGAPSIAVQERLASASDVSYLSVSTVYYLAAAAYVELYVYQDSGGSLNVSALPNRSPEFAMQWLGA